MEIQVTVRNVYGNELIYPVNKAAHDLAELARTKTLSCRTLECAETLGHVINEVGGGHLKKLDGQYVLR